MNDQEILDLHYLNNGLDIKSYHCASELTLPQVVEQIEGFLKACGYSFEALTLEL